MRPSRAIRRPGSRPPALLKRRRPPRGDGRPVHLEPTRPCQPLDAASRDPGGVGEPPPGAIAPGGATDSVDWVPAAAWSAFPTAPVEAEEELESDAADEEPIELDGEAAPARDEATTAPKVPPALPMPRRRRPIEPIRTHGSGEWYYSDAPDREPLVRRRFSAVPPVVLGVIGLLVAALVVLLIPSLLAGGGDDPSLASGASPSPGASARPRATPHPSATPVSTEAATPEPPPRVRTYRVKTGDSLSLIAERFGVGLELLQCQNLVRNPNLITVGQQLTIPPEGYACAPGWRRATPPPRSQASPEATEPAASDG